MLKDLGRRAAAGLVAAVLAAFAAGIVPVAAAFAVYAGLKLVVSPALASALTGTAFAGILGLIAVIAPRLIADKPRPAPASRLHADPAALRTAGEVAVAVIGILGDMALSRRLKRQEQARNRKHRRR